MSENKTKSSITIATVLLFVSLVVLILFVVPKVSQLKELSNKVNSKKVEYEVGLLKSDNIKQLNSMIAQYQQEAQSLGVALPISPKAEEALAGISSVANEAGLQITQAQVEGDQKGNLLISISTTGSYENQINFLDKLKSSIRPVRIEQMSMSQVDKGIGANYILNYPYFIKTNQVSSK